MNADAHDIFGAAIKSYFSGNKNSELIVHVESGPSYRILVETFFRSADALELDRVALRACKGAVLDVGAGTGEHALYLQRNGHVVTALDISAASCSIMKARGVESVIQSNILEYTFASKYDTWLLLGRSIGAVGNIDGFRNFLIKAREALNSDGKIILNSQNLSSTAGWQSRRLRFEFDGERGDVIEWFDIGERLLAAEVKQLGFSAETLDRDDHENYLALLRCSA